MTDDSTLVSPGSLVGTGDPSPVPSSGGAISSMSKNKKLAIFGGGGLVVALLVYLIAKNKSSSTSAATAAPTGTSNVAPALELPTAASTNGLMPSDLAGFGNSLSQTLAANQTQLEQQIAGLTPSSPTATATVTTTPASPSPAPVAGYTPNVVQGAGQNLDVLGAITGAGNGSYTGWNVAGGAPVYANQGGQWVMGFNPATLPSGTELATPTNFQSSIGNYGSGTL